MLDEHELRVTRALRADVEDLPMAVSASMVEDRLPRRGARRFSVPLPLTPLAAVAVVLVVAAAAALVPRQPAGGPPAGTTDGCQVTRPDPPLTAPSPYPGTPPAEGQAWYGTPELWTMLDAEGEVWDGLGASLVEKTWWWSAEWQPMGELQPDITVTGTRLDAPGAFTAGPGTNAHADDLGGWAMLVGVQLPSYGCWQLTAEYGGTSLSYVVWVREPPTYRYPQGVQEDILVGNVDVACDGRPQPDWCGAFEALSIDDGRAYVTTPLTASSADVAESMCLAIAGLAFDEDGEPIGIRDVEIHASDGDVMAECPVPSG